MLIFIYDFSFRFISWDFSFSCDDWVIGQCPQATIKNYAKVHIKKIPEEVEKNCMVSVSHL